MHRQAAAFEIGRCLSVFYSCSCKTVLLCSPAVFRDGYISVLAQIFKRFPENLHFGHKLQIPSVVVQIFAPNSPIMNWDLPVWT